MKKHNFNAGPSILADEVLENAAKAIIDFNGSGLSLLSISHRTKDFDDVMAEADALFREMLDIPENYKIFYIGGGASTFFYEVPANFLGKKAGYVNTGVWAKKAMKEAKRYGEVELLASSEDRNFTYIPKGFAIPSDLDYVHITSNNTIYGTEYHEDLVSPVPLIADMSSDILSRPVDVTKYAMIYGGAQKNLAPAGVAFAIIREDMLDRIVRDLPTMMSFRTHVENNSMFNTPPVFPIYVLKETLKWLKSIGGVGEIFRRNREKAALLYSDDATSKMNGGIVSNHDILERFSAFDAKLTVTKFLREDFAHFNALNDYNALVRLKPGEVSEAFLTEDIMGNQLAKVVKLVEIIPTHVASLNEDYLRLEEMALNAKQEKVFKDWLSKKIDAMYVYIDPEFRDGAFENKHWVK